jgi:uncharacterized protein (DUF885 family)
MTNCSRSIVKLVSVLLALCFAASVCGADRKADWDTLVDDYLYKVYFPQNPTAATLDGVHLYDAELENFTMAGARREIEELKRFASRVEEFPSAGLSAVDAADKDILLGIIRSEVLTREELKPLEKNPDVYSSGVTNGVYLLMARKFAPPDVRLRSVVARENLIPGILREARNNLQNPPSIYTEIALEQLPGIIAFYEKEVPGAFAESTDQKLRAEFSKSNAAAIDALKDYQGWLRTELFPKSHGDFRIGAVNFSKKLRYEEMVDTPLDRLLELGYSDLRKNQALLHQLTKEIDSKRSSAEVLAQLGSTHPPPDKLLETFRGTFDGLIAFIAANYIITTPPGPKPIVQETPPFERATTTASMDTPGPFETVAKDSYFDVTLPSPGDSAQDVEGLMSAFNVGTIVTTSTHETYPGHYMQFLWMNRAPTKLRRVFYSNTNAEGWAHYCEQMMLDEGYGQPGVGAKDAREAKFIRLGQLQDALLRDARFIVGIQMHTGKMNFEEAQSFFVKEGFQSAKIAEIEAKRGTSDPTYLYYTLGKLQILKLREDYKKKMGAGFSLGKFHDEFMSQGEPPIAVVRKAMLGDDSPGL